MLDPALLREEVQALLKMVDNYICKLNRLLVFPNIRYSKCLSERRLQGSNLEHKLVLVRPFPPTVHHLDIPSLAGLTTGEHLLCCDSMYVHNQTWPNFVGKGRRQVCPAAGTLLHSTARTVPTRNTLTKPLICYHCPIFVNTVTFSTGNTSVWPIVSNADKSVV